MSFLGIDIGSRFIKVAVVKDGRCIHHQRVETSYDPLKKCKELLTEYKVKDIVATGYGRHLLDMNNSIKTITEIKAFAIGARALNNKCRTIIDIGGQDTKIINLDGNGVIKKFEMNDKCSAGTGRFLEIMANALGYHLDEFSNLSEEADANIHINSMCTVFAESEVVSLITKGVKRQEIAYAIHKAIAKRVSSMLKRTSIEENVVFAGGCANNRLLRRLIEEEIGRSLSIPDEPNIVGAFGAGLFSEREYSSTLN